MSHASLFTDRKRKTFASAPTISSASRKRQKSHDARNIPTESADAALSKTGELNIASFIKSREHELAILDNSMRKARQGLSSRAFQQLPRRLRRRTASHDAKKIPRRLRRRAVREMVEDNTPTVTTRTRTPSAKLRLRLENVKSLKKKNANSKTVRQKKKEAKLNAKRKNPADHTDIVRVPRIKPNTLSKYPTATTKFKRRQVNKTWLPTHLWHTKRAHMTRPVEPLWRMAVPLTPTEKSYRPSHRSAGSRGCIAWDVSYVSSICCTGTGTALESFLKAMCFHGEGWSGSRYSRWRAGSRFAASWVYERDELKTPITPIKVFWRSSLAQSTVHHQVEQVGDQGDHEMTRTDDRKRMKPKLDNQIMIRVHPSAFLQLWQECVKVAKMQKPQVLLQDLRFELGSIDITGPGSTEALVGVLKALKGSNTAETIWPSLASVSNPAMLPINTVLAFDIHDPRLSHPPKKVSVKRDNESNFRIQEMIVDWPVDKEPASPALFSRKSRHLASCLSSQKAINRRRTTTLPGQSLQSTDKDHAIPIFLLAQRSGKAISNVQATWTLLAPWKCIDPIWRSLMYYPLSSGGTPRFGGLNQKQQIAFEQAVPWFPGDFPGTEAGKAWEQTQSQMRFDQWIRRSPGRRVAYHNIDLGLDRRGELGRAWTCDWNYLFSDSSEAHWAWNASRSQQPGTFLQTSGSARTRRQRDAQKEHEKESRRRNTSSPESDIGEEALKGVHHTELKYSQTLFAQAAAHLRCRPGLKLPSTPLIMTVRITYLVSGTPAVAARVYRLPVGTTASGEIPFKQLDSEMVTAAAQSSANTTPPAAQPSPANTPTDQDAALARQNKGLRSRWLALDPRSDMSNPSSLGARPVEMNHNSLPRKASHLPVPSLCDINVLPPNAPDEIIAQFGRKSLTESEKQAELDELLQMHVEEQKLWDVHVPCPDAKDLIGFVTSGGYNLAEGKGTAMGGIWLQRIVDGWRATQESIPAANTVGKAGRKPGKQAEREKHLCIVRNAGERIGRLAIWELCEADC